MTDGWQEPGVHDTNTEGFGVATQRLVCAARRHLGMDLAFIGEFTGGRRIFRFVDSIPGSVRLAAGDSDLLTATYCEQIVNGTTPSVIPDASAEPTVCDLAITSTLGIASYIGVPIRHADGRVFGTLCCLSHVAHAELGEEERRYLAVLAETIAAEIEAGETLTLQRQRRRGQVEQIIAERAFASVYQPIVDLVTGQVVGAEALTRFGADNRNPMAWFAEASTLGLGVDLEIAAAQAAVGAFDPSQAAFLALNLSPSALLRVDEVLAEAGSTPIVIELTEHSEIADYGALRATIDHMRSFAVRLAVDDTGAGISSLRHILELRPEIVKLDLSLTLGIEDDPVRQSMARALADFAARVGTTVVAEGIEDDAQLEMIIEVGIPYGQGYLLGRPLPLPLPAEVHIGPRG
jgi:EAL domain-containing protein (putative c-di-GMP-specific phosphodiesterase class I)